MNLWTLDPVSEDDLRVVEEEHGAFQAALGALTLHWADLEKVLRRTLRHYSGVSPEIGRALFSGTRARGAMEFISSIAHNVQLEEVRARDLEEIFSVIKPINAMRDFIVHHVDGSLIEPDDDNLRVRKVSNKHSASRAGKGQSIWVGSALIADMCADITECCWRLQAHWEPVPFKRGVGPSGAPSPWRYKSPQPKSQGRTSRARQGKPAQPKSSPG